MERVRSCPDVRTQPGPSQTYVGLSNSVRLIDSFFFLNLSQIESGFCHQKSLDLYNLHFTDEESEPPVI